MGEFVELCVFQENIDAVDFSDLNRVNRMKKPIRAILSDELVNELLPKLKNMPCFSNSKKFACVGLEVFGVFIIPNDSVAMLKDAIKKNYSVDTKAAFRLCLVAEQLNKDIVFFGI